MKWPKAEPPLYGPLTRLEDMTQRVVPKVQRLAGICALILTYFGGSAYGSSRFINHGFWPDVTLLPLAGILFALVMLDVIGPRGKRWSEPDHMLSRFIARRVIAREDRNESRACGVYTNETA